MGTKMEDNFKGKYHFVHKHLSQEVYYRIMFVLRTNSGLTELLLCDLVGDVCSHENCHGDAQFSMDDF